MGQQCQWATGPPGTYSIQSNIQRLFAKDKTESQGSPWHLLRRQKVFIFSGEENGYVWCLSCVARHIKPYAIFCLVSFNSAVSTVWLEGVDYSKCGYVLCCMPSLLAVTDPRNPLAFCGSHTVRTFERLLALFFWLWLPVDFPWPALCVIFALWIGRCETSLKKTMPGKTIIGVKQL